MLFIDDIGIGSSPGWPPRKWYSVEMKVNTTGRIIDEVNYFDAFLKINNEPILSKNNVPSTFFSHQYDSILNNDDLPFLGGGFGGSGTVRRLKFEWLKEITQPNTKTTTAKTTTDADQINEKIIMIPDEKYKIEKHRGKIMNR